MQVQEIMTREVEVVESHDDLAKVYDLMVTKALRHLPVLAHRALVAIVSQRDLFKAMLSSAVGYEANLQRAYLRNVLVQEIMSAPVVTVPPDTTLAEAAALMVHKGVGCLPVVDGATLIGIVTKTDLLCRIGG
jgi:CBS domain-containing protein